MARITVVTDYPEFLETMYAILDGDLGHEVAGFDGEEITVDDLVPSSSRWVSSRSRSHSTSTPSAKSWIAPFALLQRSCACQRRQT